jgi:hypothetical protein
MFLKAWIIMGVITECTDVILVQRRLNGKLGESVRARYVLTMSRLGGPVTAHIIGAIGNFFAPPLMLAISVFGYVHDSRASRDQRRS